MILSSLKKQYGFFFKSCSYICRKGHNEQWLRCLRTFYLHQNMFMIVIIRALLFMMQKRRFLNLEVALFFLLLQKSCFNFRKYYYTHIVKPMCAKYNVSNNIWMQQIQGIQLQRDELLKRWSYFHSCLLWKHEIGALYKRKEKERKVSRIR